MYFYKVWNKIGKAMAVAFCLEVISFESYAQPLGGEEPVKSSDTVWYLQPWLWAIVVAAVILCLVLLRRSRRRNLRSGTQKGLR